MNIILRDIMARIVTVAMVIMADTVVQEHVAGVPVTDYVVDFSVVKD